MHDETPHGEEHNHDGEQRRRRRSEGRYRLSGRFGPSGRRPAVPRRARMRQLNGLNEGLDSHELYATQTARSGEGLYTLEVWALSPRIGRCKRFILENPGYVEGAPCWGLVLSSGDSALRTVLRLRWLGRPFLPIPGPQLEPPTLLRGHSWSTCLEAEFGLHSLAEALRAQGLGVVVY